MANTWNKAGTTWGYNSWESDTVTQAITGSQVATAIGTPEAFNEAGWGSDGWGVENWGESGLSLTLTGQLATTSLGTFPYAQATDGWGRAEYGNAGWGVTYSVALSGLGLTSAVGPAEVQLLVPVTAPSALTSSLGSLITAIEIPITAPSTLTSTVGSPTYVGTNAGWGRDGWGREPWGDTDEPVVTLTGQLATASVGTLSAYNEQGWGRDPWGYENWGESALTVVVDVSSSGVATTGVGTLSPTEMSIGLTGLSSTTAVGAPGLSYGAVDLLTGVDATATVGSLSPTEMSIGLTGLPTTATVGAITPTEMSIGLTGLSSTTTVGTVEVVNTELVPLVGIEATSSVGAIIPEIGVPLTGTFCNFYSRGY